MSDEPRRADWIELFFDLVFVVTVSILARDLHGNPGPRQFLTFLVLFFPAWWAWVNLMVSVNLFGSDRLWTRMMLVVAMPGVALMAAASPDGLGSRAWAYAIGAAWVRLPVFVIWWGRGRRVESTIPAWRPIVYCLLTAGLWLVSAFVPSSARYLLWTLAILLEIVLLSFGRGISSGVYSRLVTEHLIERVGLFVVIVFGETVYTLVLALAEHFTVPAGAAALGSFVLVATLAISFFRWSIGMAELRIGEVQTRSVRAARAALRDSVMYLPFLLITAIIMLAAALGTAISDPEHKLPSGGIVALVTGIAGFYAVNGLISWRLGTALRTIPRWAVPAILLPLLVVLPLSTVVSSWVAATIAALSTLAMFTYSSVTAPAPAVQSEG